MIETVGQLKKRLKDIKDNTKVFVQFDGLYYPLSSLTEGFVEQTTNWAKDKCFDAVDPEDAHTPFSRKKVIEAVLID